MASTRPIWLINIAGILLRQSNRNEEWDGIPQIRTCDLHDVNQVNRLSFWHFTWTPCSSLTLTIYITRLLLSFSQLWKRQNLLLTMLDRYNLSILLPLEVHQATAVVSRGWNAFRRDALHFMPCRALLFVQTNFAEEMTCTSHRMGGVWAPVHHRRQFVLQEARGPDGHES